MERKKGFFGKLAERIGDVILARPEIDEEFLEELEEILITSDVSMDTTEKIVSELRYAIKSEYLSDPEAVKEKIAEIAAGLLDKGERHELNPARPLVITMIGVNGGGKTTTAGKLAAKLKAEGNSVMLAAADTFRAAASEQLQIWGERTGCHVVRHQEGADPSAVIYDACQAAKARGVDVLICDTAGRLQTKKNLMAELEKMNKIIDREFPEAARETLLVLDATIGKNAISQAQEFGGIAELTGLVLTKLDGTSKGGIVVSIADMFDLAVKYIGVGEGADDLRKFDPKEFAGGIFDE